MSNSNNGSNNNSNNGGSMKSKLVINDLAFYSNLLSVGDSSLSNVADDGELFSEFAGQGLSVEAVDYLIAQEAKDEKKDVIGAKALLKANDVSFDESWSDELIMLFAEQYIDSISNVSGYASNRAEGVLVIVQALSQSGKWYTVKNGEEKATYWYDVDTLFEKQNGSISGLKTTRTMVGVPDLATRKINMVERVLPVVVADMKALGHVVDGYIGRVLLKSSAFIRGTMIEGTIIEEVPAQFSLAVKDGVVYDKETNYAWDNIVEVFPGISVLPSDSDTTQAKLDTMIHDDNIIVGMSIVTPAMSAYLMDSAERNAQIALEEECEIIAVKAKLPTLMKQERHNAIIKSDVGEAAQFIIDLSYADAESALLVAEKETDRMADIFKAMYAIKMSTGTGCNYAVYKKLQDLYNKPAKEKAMREIEMHILENIALLNNGEISISDLTDEEAVEILDAAIANAKLVPAAKIELSVYRPLADRVKGIKFNNKAAEARAMFPKSVA